MSEPLTAVFGNQARVKLLRMFLFNPSNAFTIDEITRRAKLSRRSARTEVNQLGRADIIRTTRAYEIVPKTKRKRPTQGYIVNQKSPIVPALQTFLFETAPLDGKTLQRHVRNVGKIQVLVAAGAFVKEFDRRLDVLIAVEKIRPGRIEIAMRNLEAELGVGIKYAAFTTTDLLYRLGMYDKLTRDVFDYPHQLLIDKVGVRDELKR